MKTYDLIKQLLEKYPELRNNDKELQWKVCENQGITVNGFLSKENFLYKAKSFETIRRSRQKAQEENPHLRANPQTQEARMEKQKSKGTWIFRDNIARFVPND